jgi:hypothetical protein
MPADRVTRYFNSQSGEKSDGIYPRASLPSFPGRQVGGLILLPRIDQREARVYQLAQTLGFIPPL